MQILDNEWSSSRTSRGRLCPADNRWRWTRCSRTPRSNTWPRNAYVAWGNSRRHGGQDGPQRSWQRATEFRQCASSAHQSAKSVTNASSGTVWPVSKCDNEYMCFTVRHSGHYVELLVKWMCAHAQNDSSIHLMLLGGCCNLSTWSQRWLPFCWAFDLHESSLTQDAKE